MIYESWVTFWGFCNTWGSYLYQMLMVTYHMRFSGLSGFFYLDFLSRTFTDHTTAGKGKVHFLNSSLPLPFAPQTLIHKLGNYHRSPQHIASDWTQARNPRFLSTCYWPLSCTPRPCFRTVIWNTGNCMYTDSNSS